MIWVSAKPLAFDHATLKEHWSIQAPRRVAGRPLNHPNKSAHSRRSQGGLQNEQTVPVPPADRHWQKAVSNDPINRTILSVC